MSLEYWREYRTFFHVGKNYGVSESNCRKIIIWVENTLIKSEKFSLPGKKALLTTESGVKTALLDTEESPIERPKKTETILLRQEKASYHESASRGEQRGQRHHLHRCWQGANA